MKSLKKHIITFIIYGIIGVVLIAFGLISHSDSFVTSFGFAILAAAAVKIIRLIFIAKAPEKAKRFENTQKDERYIALAQKSGYYTFLISVFSGVVAGFVLIFLNMEQAARIVMNVTAIEVLVFGIVSVILYRKY